MDAATREFVRLRAGNQCEYCRLPQYAVAHSKFHIEHIVARQHHGSDDRENLALACERCNFYKGTNLSAIDPATGDIVPIFNPRKDPWEQHFILASGRIHGISAMGRATVRLLNMNSPARVELRSKLK
jgi:5-methylcytosine-specific restriction endonuclease McrA